MPQQPSIKKAQRVRLSPETRERLVHAYVKRYLAKEGKLPNRRQVCQAVGGSIQTILAVLREYRNDGDQQN
jgi:hypothetical protein